MAKEIIAVTDGTLSFGDSSLETKTKQDGFEYKGDIYKVKTYKDLTKLERNEMFLYESVPGTDVSDFTFDADGVSFTVVGSGEVQITLGLGDDAEYDIIVDGEKEDRTETSMGGKIAFTIELDGEPAKVAVRR
ncbi:MAG: endosialidase [Lachnospiraceae bacterium]|nr:endosialidase [Lachnospiraceae bacterium]